MDYQDFWIKVHNNGDIYAHSKQGDFNGRLNLDRKEIDVDLKLIAEDRKVEELSKNVGTKLYDALFDKEISRSFASAMATCDNQKECGVRLR